MTDQITLYRDGTTGMDYADDIGETTPVSWQPRADLRFEEWLAIGNTLQQVGASLNWWIGDWLNYGERKWGEMYAQAVETTGWEYQRLANAKYVSSRVHFSLRKEKLTFTHHAEVAPLEPDEQAAWLNRAATEGWTTRQLRDEIRGISEPGDSEPVSIELPEPISEKELLATQRGGLVMYWLFMGICKTTAGYADMLEMSESGAWRVLDKLSEKLPITNENLDPLDKTWHLVIPGRDW